MNMESDSGTTLIKLPGSSTFRRLVGGAQIPVGAVVDATRGAMGITSVDGSSDFRGGMFTVREPKVGGVRVTHLALSGGNFAVCPPVKKTKRHTAGAGAAPKPKAKPTTIVRQLFGSGKGRFRTSGRFAAATVRGTVWRIEDRCDGTWTQVLKGSVAVTDLRKHRTTIVKAGHTFLVLR
jgi:hypothetical protein